MDKGKKLIVVLLCIFMVINIWLILSMKDQITVLHDKIGRMQSEFNNEITDTSQDINNLKNDLISIIAKNESLLSSIETEVGYINDLILFTIQIVPKEKNNNESIFLSLGDEKKEAVSADGSVYTAYFEITMPQRIIPVVSFESQTGVRQEVLPETNINDLLSLQYKSYWKDPDSSSDNDEETLQLTVYAKDQKSYSLLSGAPAAVIVIKDAYTSDEIGRKTMQIIENDKPFNKELNAITFNADLSEFCKREGSYFVWVEFRTESGILYSDQIASFSNEYDRKGDSSGGSLGEGGGILFPIL